MSTRTTAEKNSQGRPVYISGGANRQDGQLKLYTCNTCHRLVVWATSARTGKLYLANVYQGESGIRYYVKASAHQCQNPADSAALIADLERRIQETCDIETETEDDEAAGVISVELRDRLCGQLKATRKGLRVELRALTGK
jgi:hypothetical protein